MRAAIWPTPNGSCSAIAEVVTPITGTAMVPIAATEAGSRDSAANQLTSVSYTHLTLPTNTEV